MTSVLLKSSSTIELKQEWRRRADQHLWRFWKKWSFWPPNVQENDSVTCLRKTRFVGVSSVKEQPKTWIHGNLPATGISRLDWMTILLYNIYVFRISSCAWVLSSPYSHFWLTGSKNLFLFISSLWKTRGNTINKSSSAIFKNLWQQVCTQMSGQIMILKPTSVT